MIRRNDLMQYLNDLLLIDKFVDYCPNGLQVEGCDRISKIITGVSACQALLQKALDSKADALIVHHGYFWKNEASVIRGTKRVRLATLLSNELNLFAYHLPLDAQPRFGNNAQLAQHLDLNITDHIDVGGNPGILYMGELKAPMPGDAFAQLIRQRFNREPLYIPANSPIVKRIAWCSGAGQDLIEQAINLGVDAYLTGEVSERTVHLARESGIHFYSAGHHATERYGVKALGEHLQARFKLEHEFIDIANPV